MKKLLLIFFGIITSHCLRAQTRLIDSNMSWAKDTLTLYTTDSIGIVSLNLSLGTALDSTDVYTHTWMAGSDFTGADNMIEVPLTGITPGAFY